MTDTSLPPGGAVEQMCDLMLSLAKALVDQPEEVRVEPATSETDTVQAGPHRPVYAHDPERRRHEAATPLQPGRAIRRIADR